MSRAVHLANHPVRQAVLRTGVNPTLIVQRGKGWIKCREEGCCRMCRRSSMIRPLTRHHVVPLSWFRNRERFAPLRHVDANIVPLCAPCHRDIERRTPHARTELRRLLSNVEIAFVIQVAGQQWLDDRYPSNGRSSIGHAGAANRPIHRPDCAHRMCVDSCTVGRVASSPGLGSSA